MLLLLIENIRILEVVSTLFYQCLHSNKLENLKEIIVYRNNLPKLNQDQTDNLNRSVVHSETEVVFLSVPVSTLAVSVGIYIAARHTKTIATWKGKGSFYLLP